MRAAFFIFIILLPGLLHAQDLTGIWRGSFSSSVKVMDMFNMDDSYKLEVQIDQHNKSFNSVTYSYKTTTFYGKATATGTFNPKTDKVWLQETKIVEVKMSSGSSACIMTYFLQHSKNGDEEFLEGKWIGYNELDSSYCGRGTVYLRKVTTSDFHLEPFLANREKTGKKTSPPVPAPQKKAGSPPLARNTHPPVISRAPVTSRAPITSNAPSKTVHPPAVTPLNKPKNDRPNTTATREKIVSPKPSENRSIPELAKEDTVKKDMPSLKRAEPAMVPRVLATRENTIVKTITVNSNEISINIYDNGTIDHDTISVYLDKKLVVSKQMLTTSPINVKLKMDDSNAYHELIMVAENEGDIPPNTSLMVVKAGDQQYEVRITSTEQKNAVVIFKYERPK